jgi:hypothetical protein
MRRLLLSCRCVGGPWGREPQPSAETRCGLTRDRLWGPDAVQQLAVDGFRARAAANTARWFRSKRSRGAVNGVVGLRGRWRARSRSRGAARLGFSQVRDLPRAVGQFGNQVVPIFTKLGCNAGAPWQGQRSERLSA